MRSTVQVDPTTLLIAPVTSERWNDLVALLGVERGGHNGCWCQWFRLMRVDYEALSGAERRKRLAHTIETGPSPGVLAYHDSRPVGWCAVSPRNDQPRLDKGRVSRRRDDRSYGGVWVITCFFVAIDWRKRGLMRPLIKGASEFAREQGACAIEAYPMIPNQRTSNADVYVGQRDAFVSCGYRQIEKPLPQRAVVRLDL